MITPRLQMKAPYVGSAGFRLPDRHVYSWEDYVRNAYNDFTPPFAANEGVEAIIGYMSPSGQNLKVGRLTICGYEIESTDGLRLYLTQPDEDSLVLSVYQPVPAVCEQGMDLSCYDASDTAAFINRLFTQYGRL